MRYQSGMGHLGVMDTEAWFRALLAGVDGELGDVLDVGCAEGIMCALADQAGATSVLGIGLHDDRMTAAKVLTADMPNVRIMEQEASTFNYRSDTIVFSMMAHWLGANETARFASLARKYFLVVFRAANDHYSIPENGTWFPTLREMDATVGGIRTHEALLLEQDHGKEVWAATYRMDMRLYDGIVRKRNYSIPFHDGRDLHGDPPFRPTHGRPLALLTDQEKDAVRCLVREVADAALKTGWYPTDFSPRNVIVNDQGAYLVDLDEIEPTDGTVDIQYLAIWQRTLSTVGIDFNGDLRSLL